MSARTSLRLTNARFAGFFDRNPHFDLLTHDFFDPARRAVLVGDAGDLAKTLEELRPYQRLLRLLPLTEVRETMKMAEAEPLIEGLMERGFHSAHDVAGVAPHQFVRRTAGLLGEDGKLAREIHRRAVQVKAAVRHLFANVRDVAGSPLTRAGLPTYAQQEVVDYFRDLPSYQSLFGSLDYIEVPHCASIFSPAAYFLDIMRITDAYITDYNRETIPDGYRLDQRRGDLFDKLKLSCEETDGLIAYVSLVRQILVAKLEQELDGDPFQKVATAPYPFNLPFNRSRTDISLTLETLGTGLSALGQAMLAPRPGALGFASHALARAYLGLSAEQNLELTSVNDTDAAVGAQYGLDTISEGLPAKGQGTITYAKEKTLATGADGSLGKLLEVGQHLASQGQIRTVEKIVDDASVQVDIPWVEAGDKVAWTRLGNPVDLTLDASFRDLVGDMSYVDLQALLTQNLSEAELDAGDAAVFFINDTGESLPAMAVKPADAEKGNVGARLTNLSPKRLDRLSRFIRLSRHTGIAYATLDWLMRVAGASEITDDLVDFLAGAKQIAATVGLRLEQAAALVGPFKTTGRGDGPNPADPFDEVFNSPALLGGEEPWSAASPVPFDPTRPLAWAPRGLSGPGSSGTLAGVTSNTAVLSQQASSTDGAYVGVELAITDGAGADQLRIIKEYDGATRTATLYTPWKQLPEQAAYRLQNEVGVEGRLAAAIQVNAADLRTLGDAYKTANAPDAEALLLDLDTLTGLWRLGKIAWLYRVPVAEYLVARRLAGLNEAYQSTAIGALSDVQTAVSVLEWLRRWSMSAYELDYVVDHTRTRYVRPPFDPETVPGLLADMASAAQGTHLTAERLSEAGFSADAAAEILDGLRAGDIIDAEGLMTPHDAEYVAVSARFPVTVEELKEQAELTNAEAKATVDTLKSQSPPALQPIQGKSGEWALTAAYDPLQPLDNLFVAFTGAENKRARVAAYLEDKARLVGLAEISPLFPVAAASAFVSRDIGAAQSRAVFDALAALSPPVLLPEQSGDAGSLNALYDGSSRGWALFESAATGQTSAVAGYDPATHVATVEPAWKTAPDAFTYYQITASQQAGTARGGSKTEIVLAEDASPDDGAYTGCVVALTGGPGAGDRRRITTYDGGRRAATVSEAWTTDPTDKTTYDVHSVLLEGDADGGTGTTIALGESASNAPDAYAGCAVNLLADPDATGKTAQVVAVLDGVRTEQVLLVETLAGTAQAQQAAAVGGIASALAVASADVVTALPFATATLVQPRLLVPTFLGGDSAADQKAATSVLDGISRFGVLRGAIKFSNPVWRAIFSQPALFSLGPVSALGTDDLRRLGDFKQFCGDIGDDGSGTASYLALWVSILGESEQRKVLFDLTGWEPAEVADVDAYLSEALPGYPGIGVLAGILRLVAPFEVMAKTSGSAGYLIDLAGIIQAPALGPIGGDVAPKRWSAIEAAASASTAVLAARYKDESFADVADRLQRGNDAAQRDALLGYLIWTLGFRGPSELFQYLLIDVEASDCDTTSPIAQGINSVQLYMQRCRMGLEPGVTVDHIPRIWWTWMSNYRLWEVNRKIFLYPENYLVPSQRKSATPQFKALGDKLMQSRPTDENVADAMVGYFDDFEVLASLIPVGATKAEQTDKQGGQIDETGVIVGRTNTSPYKYYLRQFTRSTIPDNLLGGQDPVIVQWGPWLKVDASIDAQFVMPVWSFDRPFLFWNEIKPTKSSTIQTGNGADGLEAASNTQSTWQSTLKYTFRTSTGDWLAAQQLLQPTPIRIAPNTYGPAAAGNVQKAFDNVQHYWKQPFAQAIPRGLPGTGALTFKKGSQTASGHGTILDKQIKPGDFIVTAGQKLQVKSVDAAAQTLETKTQFVLNGTAVPFNVVPKDPTDNRYPPYQGPGTVKLVAGFNVVDGVDTRFDVDFTPGDFIQVGDETRTVQAVFGANQLVVGKNWDIGTFSDGDGQVTLFPRLFNVAGDGTRFTKQARSGELVVAKALGQSRVIVEVESDTSLLIDRPFDVDQSTDSDYQVGVAGTYTVLPRASGAEKLMVFYGPNMGIQTDWPATGETPPHEDNRGDDPFTGAKNDFNDSLWRALKLVGVVRNDKTLPQWGDITGQRSLTLDGALAQRDIRLFAPVTGAQMADTSGVFRIGVDRENRVLYAAPGDRPMVSLYWGNSTPGTTANQEVATAEDRPLLYHVNADNAALIGVGNQLGWYLFNNDSDYFLITLENISPLPVGFGAVLRTFWQPASSGDLMMEIGPYSLGDEPFQKMTFRLTRLSTDVAGFLKQRLFVGFDSLLSLDSQSLPEQPVDQYFKTPQGAPPPTLDAKYLPPSIMSFTGPYGLYFWEIFYQAPMLVAEWLKSNHDFEQAKRWYEYIFDPTAPDDPSVTGNARFWQFRPFREDMSLPSLLQVLTNTFEINKSNDDPFDPHAIAALRISAYAKATVQSYVDNLIRWADALFTLDTRESITQATNLYLLARDLLGERPEVVGVFTQPSPLTFNEIKAKYPNGIPEYLIDLENTPFVPPTGQGARYGDVPVNDIHAYFGVPDNQDLVAFWDTIDDRLFKIRNCMNINGVVRQLALFAPPLDPAAVIAGFGTQGSLTGGASFSPYPIPNYRFNFLIQMAKSLADQVVRFGSALLTALGQKDAEALAQLRLTQEAQLLQLTTEIKNQALVQIQDQADSLREAQQAAQARLDHYTSLLNEDWLGEEIAQLSLMSVSAVFSATSSVLGAAASVAAAFPQVGSPFAITFGGQQLGPSLQNAAGWTQAMAQVLDTTGQILGVVAGHKRTVEEWELQKKLAGFDVAQIQAQIDANAVQQTIAQRELQIHQTQIDQNEAMQEFYQRKFTSEALFSWMAGRLATTHFQAYSLALEFARMAQRAYQFEYRTEAAFIAATYWDDLRKGLTAGEGLSQALGQLEGAYVRSAFRLQEVTKVVSLRQHDPVAFLRFARTGETDFELPERLFDQDFPGQYKRRIKSLTVSIPALVGPYQNIHATLTQTGSRVVLQPDLDAVKFLLGDDVEVAAGKIEHNVRAYQKISLSKAQGDSGLFDPNPGDPMYLPFEQTGAVSSWHLSMPPQNNLIAYQNLSDVVLEVRYTALDGGESFRSKVAGLPQLRERELTRLVQPALQYQAAWSRFMDGPVAGDSQMLRFDALALVPPNLAKASVLGVYVLLDVPEGTALASQKAYLTVSVAGSDAVALRPTSDGIAMAVFDRPVPLKSKDAPITAAFDLRAGYTPTGLRTDDGKRLDPAVVRDVDVVLFVSGLV